MSSLCTQTSNIPPNQAINRSFPESIITSLVVDQPASEFRIATPQTFISSEPRNTNNIPSRLATCNFPISTPARPFSILAWPLCDHCWCQHMQISRVHGRLQQTTRHKIFLSRSRRQDTTSCGNLEPGFIELKWHEANTGTKSHVAFVSATSKCHFSQLEVTQSVGVFAALPRIRRLEFLDFVQRQFEIVGGQSHDRLLFVSLELEQQPGHESDLVGELLGVAPVQGDELHRLPLGDADAGPHGQPPGPAVVLGRLPRRQVQVGDGVRFKFSPQRQSQQFVLQISLITAF
jgi:hypothetical protein